MNEELAKEMLFIRELPHIMYDLHLEVLRKDFAGLLQLLQRRLLAVIGGKLSFFLDAKKEQDGLVLDPNQLCFPPSISGPDEELKKLAEQIKTEFSQPWTYNQWIEQIRREPRSVYYDSAKLQDDDILSKLQGLGVEACIRVPISVTWEEGKTPDTVGFIIIVTDALDENTRNVNTLMTDALALLETRFVIIETQRMAEVEKERALREEERRKYTEQKAQREVEIWRNILREVVYQICDSISFCDIELNQLTDIAKENVPLSELSLVSQRIKSELGKVHEYLDLPEKFAFTGKYEAKQQANIAELMKHSMEQVPQLTDRFSDENMDFHIESDIRAEVHYELLVRVLRGIFMNAVQHGIRKDRKRKIQDGNLLNRVLHRSSKQDSDEYEPQLKIECCEEAQRIVIEISDNGEGVPDDKLNTIFEPGAKLNELKPGYGMGLTFAKYVIEEKHSGTIGASPTAWSDKGLSIGIRIPKSV